jgi:hypothetical protein
MGGWEMGGRKRDEREMGGGREKGDRRREARWEGDGRGRKGDRKGKGKGDGRMVERKVRGGERVERREETSVGVRNFYLKFLISLHPGLKANFEFLSKQNKRSINVLKILSRDIFDSRGEILPTWS